MFFGVANGVSTEMPVMVFEWTDLTDFRVTHLATPPPKKKGIMKIGRLLTLYFPPYYQPV